MQTDGAHVVDDAFVEAAHAVRGLGVEKLVDAPVIISAPASFDVGQAIRCRAGYRARRRRLSCRRRLP